MDILFIDDNTDILEIFGEILEGSGHKVETAGDGMSALKLYNLCGWVVHKRPSCGSLTCQLLMTSLVHQQIYLFRRPWAQAKSKKFPKMLL